MSELTPERIAELRRLAEAATPGPWELGPLHKTSEGKTWLTFDEQREIFPPLERRPHHAQYGGPIAVTSEGECANGEYLAACDPQTVLALCDLAARALAAEAERDRLREAIREAGFGIMQSAGELSIHDVSDKAKADEEQTAKVIMENIELTKERDRLMEEMDELKQAYGKLDSERDRLAAELAAYRGVEIEDSQVPCSLTNAQLWQFAKYRTQQVGTAARREVDRLAADNAQLRRDLDVATDTNAHADLVRLLASNPGEAAVGLVQQLTSERDCLRDLAARLASALEAYRDDPAKADIEAVTVLALWRAYCERSKA